MDANAPIPAAEYVRMSTEEQPNSITIQQTAIRRYADAHGYQVVLTYADPGKSGIEIKHRPGLRQLIQDVIGGRPLFRAILVFDVSRWGRFQDTDESAHYEFLCRSAGIPVHYCAELFENDGTLSSDMMKALRRTMAAEYSRDLAMRVRSGLRLLAQRGFHVGGVAGYGLKRLLISADGGRKQILLTGQLKNIRSDRIILVPGSKKEVEVIRLIFFLASEKKQSPRRIAEELTKRGIAYQHGRPWTKSNVRVILKNEKYIGSNVWGKTTKPFNGSVHKLPRSAWVVKENAFKPLVTPEQFARVQSLFHERYTKNRKPEEFYLKEMRRILAREGKLTEKLLKKRGIFDHRAYIRRFGSTLRAYELVGFKPTAQTLKCRLGFQRFQKIRLHLVNRLSGLFPSQLKIIKRPHQADRISIELDNKLQVAINICRPTVENRKIGPRWVLTRHCQEDSLVSLICLSDKQLTGFVDFYVVPPTAGLLKRYKVLREGHPLLRAGKRLDSLSQLYDVAREIAEKWNPADNILVLGDTQLDERASQLKVAEKEISLSPMEASILRKLLNRADTPVSVQELEIASKSVNVFAVRHHIECLRQKLGRKLRTRLVTVEKKGYMYLSNRNCSASAPRR